MRLTVTHDVQGNIAAVVASPPDSPVMYLVARPGQRVTELEIPELKSDKGIDQIREHLTELIENHQVAIESSKGRLLQKPDVLAKKPSA
jgi:hypothetical protein